MSTSIEGSIMNTKARRFKRTPPNYGRGLESSSYLKRRSSLNSIVNNSLERNYLSDSSINYSHLNNAMRDGHCAESTSSSLSGGLNKANRILRYLLTFSILLIIFTCERNYYRSNRRKRARGRNLRIRLEYQSRISPTANSAKDTERGNSNIMDTESLHRNNNEMMERIQKATLSVPRTARIPSKYTPPNPKLEIPSNIDGFLTDIKKDMGNDVPLFWHVLKSGGTTMKDAIGLCLNKVEASESGILDGHIHDRQLQKIKIGQGPIQYVNVDTTTTHGIKRSIAMGLIESKMSDVIFTPLLHESTMLFNNTSHNGRAFTLFRHPVERAVSLFHYLQRADWEPTFSKKLESIKTLEDYAISEFAENNWMTRFLTNEITGIVTRRHLSMAKEILRRKVLVGLTNDMDNSFHRFMTYFGWNKEPLSPDQRGCLKNYLNSGSNVNKYALETEDSIGWRILRSNNLLDLELYDYALQLYDEQGKMLGFKQ